MAGAVLIYGDSFRSADMRHAVPLGVPDPFLYAEENGTRHVFSNSMEAPRIRELGLFEVHIGEDFGFNPVFLRVPLATAVIWNPLIAFGTYFALGAVVFASRVLFPRPKSAPAPQLAAEHAENDAAGEERLAA